MCIEQPTYMNVNRHSVLVPILRKLITTYTDAPFYTFKAGSLVDFAAHN